MRSLCTMLLLQASLPVDGVHGLWDKEQGGREGSGGVRSRKVGSR